ncbi:MAG: HEAT repeat domain-containing protein, partial [Pyrinomonadaceae bacterium]
MNQQIKAGLSAVKEFLAGRSSEANVPDADDNLIREVVAAELLATMAGRSTDETSPENPEKAPSDTQEIPSSNSSGAVPDTKEENETRQTPQSDHVANSVAHEHFENSTGQEQGRARQLFMNHGYFDDAVQNLRAADSPEERAAAARALGLVGSQRATAHLIAAMFDDDPTVRQAAEVALSQIGDAPVTDFDIEATSNDETERTNEAESRTSELGQQEWEIESAPPQVVVAAAKSDIAEQGGQAARAQDELETSAHPNVAVQTGAAELTVTDSISNDEEQLLLLEENKLRKTVEQLALQLIEIAAARNELEQEVERRTESEAKLLAKAAARRLEEQEVRKRAEEEAEVRRAQERDAVTVEQAARLEAEAEAERYADEEKNLRLKAASLRLDAADAARRRADMEAARNEALEAVRHAEAMHARNEARSRHEAELGRLRAEEEALQKATDEVLLQQTNMRVARDKAA